MDYGAANDGSINASVSSRPKKQAITNQLLPPSGRFAIVHLPSLRTEFYLVKEKSLRWENIQRLQHAQAQKIQVLI